MTTAFSKCGTFAENKSHEYLIGRYPLYHDLVDGALLLAADWHASAENTHAWRNAWGACPTSIEAESTMDQLSRSRFMGRNLPYGASRPLHFSQLEHDTSKDFRLSQFLELIL
jgi:hypothetical protein